MDNKPISSDDEGYESEDEELNKIRDLETALQEANTKIREQEQSLNSLNHKINSDKEIINNLQQNNQSLNKTIEELKNKPENKEANQEQELFTCLTCQKTFSYKLIRLVDKNQQKVCRDCLLKMLNRANQITGEEIVLRKKKKEEIKEISQPTTFTCQTCQQNYQGQPHQVHISNYQEQGIIPQQLTSICSYCLQDKVAIADLYCPRTSEGRDTWNPNEPQFDCACPTNL